MQRVSLLGIGILMLLLGTLSSVSGQTPTVITMTAPQYFSDFYENTVIPAFEAEHPDIQVQFVFTEDNYFGSPLALGDDENDYYTNLETYASTADVLYIASYNFNHYATNTGFFLDLSPLANVDNTLAPDDFYPAAWEAFQWDGGLWGLPYALRVQLLVYNQDRFDEAGLAYPNQDWRFQDFVRASEALHTYNNEGLVELAPLNIMNMGLLMYLEAGDFYDDSVMPAQPDFDNPALVSALDMWINYRTSFEEAQGNGWSSQELAMTIEYPYQLQGMNNENINWGISLLPGGRVSTQAEGYAVSSGTAHPEAAYELVKFMTNNVDVMAQSFGSSPARRSLVNAEPSEDVFMPQQQQFEPEVQALIDEGLENAISPSELRYADMAYFVFRNEPEEGGLDIPARLQDVKTTMIEALNQAQAQQSTQITVALPELRPELAPGEVVLNFGLNTPGGNNQSEVQAQWQAVIDEFVASQPTIGDVDLDRQIYGPTGISENLDCYYDGFASGANVRAQQNVLLAIDPFLNVDPDFNQEDFLAGVLAEGQVEGLTYGYPIDLQPMMMWVNVDKLIEAGLPIPEGTWTTNDFVNVLAAFESMRDDPETLIVRSLRGRDITIEMLLAAFGGLAIDYRQDPLVYNLTDPTVVAAAQQVVEYARNNVIAYESLSDQTRGGGGGFFNPMDEDNYIIVDTLSNFSFITQSTPFADETPPLQPVTFPIGEYAPVSYQVGMAFIRADTNNAQACYDWIATISNYPELFAAMPARQSVLQSPAFTASQDPAVLDFYQTFADVMRMPNALPMPSHPGAGSTSPGAWLEPNFFYLALDNAVANDTNVATTLDDAAANLTAYRDCTVGIEEIPIEELEAQVANDPNFGLEYTRQYVDCAVNIAPQLREVYSYFYDN